MDDFETVKKKAWSLPSGEDSRGELIYVEETKYGTFRYYYEASTGEYWYQSSGTETFNKWMKEREKERKECLRKSRNGSKMSHRQSCAQMDYQREWKWWTSI